MNIKFHRKFKKSLRKQDKRTQDKFFEKLDLFVNDQFHYPLNNHALTGEFYGWRSINISGDVRVHYQEEESGIILINIGKHSQLY